MSIIRERTINVFPLKKIHNMFYILLQFFREAEARLVEDYRQSYLSPHIEIMVHEERTGDLNNMFLLLRPLPHALEPVVKAFRHHVTSQGEFD